MWLEYVLRGWIACGLFVFFVTVHYIYLIEKRGLLFPSEILSRSEKAWLFGAMFFMYALFGPIAVVYETWNGLFARYYHALTPPQQHPQDSEAPK